MLRLRPYSRVHWIGVALAFKLAGNSAEARRFLNHIDSFLRVWFNHPRLTVPIHHSFQNVSARDPEYGEFVLFHIRVLEEQGEWQEALALLDKKVQDKMLVDLPSIAQCRGEPASAHQS